MENILLGINIILAIILVIVVLVQKSEARMSTESEDSEIPFYLRISECGPMKEGFDKTSSMVADFGLAGENFLSGRDLATSIVGELCSSQNPITAMVLSESLSASRGRVATVIDLLRVVVDGPREADAEGLVRVGGPGRAEDVARRRGHGAGATQRLTLVGDEFHRLPPPVGCRAPDRGAPLARHAARRRVHLRKGAKFHDAREELGRQQGRIGEFLRCPGLVGDFFRCRAHRLAVPRLSHPERSKPPLSAVSSKAGA